MQTKTALRTQLLQQRRDLTPMQQSTAAFACTHHLEQLSWLTEWQHIAIYLSGDGELPTQPLAAFLWRHSKTCYLPLLDATQQRQLRFAHYHNQTILTANRFGILEPDPETADFFPAPELDIIFLPLVGFDRAGNRLGRGAGYYDKTLSFLVNGATQKKPRLIGLGYAFQEVDALPHDSWDIRLDAIATDKEFIIVDKGK